MAAKALAYQGVLQRRVHRRPGFLDHNRQERFDANLYCIQSQGLEHMLALPIPSTVQKGSMLPNSDKDIRT